MRLACPNCDARYEVPEDAIPASGRDVQCSNCGHAWFHTPGAAEASLPLAGTARAAGDEVVDADAGHPEVEETAGTAMHDEAAQVDPSPRSEPGSRPPADNAPRPGLDAGVMAILREEAAHEAEARRAEAAGRENVAGDRMQARPASGIAAPAVSASPGGSERQPDMAGGEDHDTLSPSRPVARRDLLPDVEDINSTLQPDAGLDPDAEVDALPDLTRRNAFRSGFLLALLLLALALAVYALAPVIAARLPWARASLEAYVALVDGLREWLNALMSAAGDRLDGSGS